MILRNTILIILIVSIQYLGTKINAQNIKDSMVFSPLVKINLAIQSPQGDLKDYFGTNTNIGCSLGFKSKRNITLELDYNFIHSKNVKYRGTIDHLLNSQNWIINQYGEPNLYVLYHRGGQLSFDIGKIINFRGLISGKTRPNPNSGIHFKTGIGLMYHKIRIENENNT